MTAMLQTLEGDCACNEDRVTGRFSPLAVHGDAVHGIFTYLNGDPVSEPVTVRRWTDGPIQTAALASPYVRCRMSGHSGKFFPVLHGDDGGTQGWFLPDSFLNGDYTLGAWWAALSKFKLPLPALRLPGFSASLSRFGSGIGKGFGKIGQGLSKNVSNLSRSAQRATSTVTRNFTRTGQALEKTVRSGGQALERTGRAIGKGLETVVRTVAEPLLQTLSPGMAPQPGDEDAPPDDGSQDAPPDDSGYADDQQSDGSQEYLQGDY